ncbi:aminoglycoside 3'-phosphotransferase [Deinococcus detaillensis]|uniref:Aminoglycoside 3'-phosphotransferase n=1 Tax=Deinococcus detaillensis TaxID=2592048 RepID=A0A553V413_9DEIO|nr:APH(3') family aminoglycoside O-phosphotransferase [Deinococcus detaillensis]TSA87199.1 aminoglycoside 3'-phosphotransferase [Deinococcus detaillensis]
MLNSPPELSLPTELKRVLPAARWQDVSGDSGAWVWQSQKYVVKVQPLGRLESLRTEQTKLRWLSGRLPVPQIVGYATDEQSEYLATARLPGLPMHHPDALLHALRNADLLARALRELHSLPIRECPFNQSLALKLRQARERAELGLVDETDFDAERLGQLGLGQLRVGQSAEQVLKYLVKSRPATEDVVVTHGDACLPNFLVSGEVVEGLIDVGRLGIADRHQDLALAQRSLIRNAGDEAAEHFLDVYGRQWVDASKLAYYQILDELF